MSKDERIAAVLKRRWNDCLDKQRGLSDGDDAAIHAFRLACKQLRYAIELFDVRGLAPQMRTLAALTGELGTAHDCIVLAARARAASAESVERRALEDRESYVHRAAETWNSLKPQLESSLP